MNRFSGCLLPLVLFVCVFLAVPARAQLGIALSAGESKFLRYEPVELTVTLRNYSGNTLTFGEEGANRGYLFFQLDRHDGRRVRELRPEGNPVVGLVLNAGETKALTVPLNDLFDLHAPGSYTAKAQVGHARLSHDYQSETVTFDVREGLTVLSRHVGLPGGDGEAKIKKLTVSLVLFQGEREAIYCLRVEDDRLVYGTIRLGRQISSSEPEMDADATSDVHVLLQVAARVYSYQVYSLTGGQVRLRQEKYYLPGEAVPRLSRSPGFITVVNGRPAVEGVDYVRDADGQLRPRRAE